MAGRAYRAPGTVPPRRFVPRLHYELLVCGLRGHELIGTDSAQLTAADAVVAREIEGMRWHRCLRCDSWLPLAPPDEPARATPPAREQIELPLRGKALRDKIVLRAIAIDRAVHFVLLGALAVAILVFAAHEESLRRTFYRVLADIQGGVAGGPVQAGHTGVVHELDKLFTLRGGTLHLLAAAIGAYALLEGAEAVGLWYQKRWAEYLTFIATTAFLPLEIFELTRRVSALKITALIVNVAVVIYLLLAKRLFGLRGGSAADEALRQRDMGWPALERTAPEAAALAAGAVRARSG